jgi:hypothetical protein
MLAGDLPLTCKRCTFLRPRARRRVGRDSVALNLRSLWALSRLAMDDRPARRPPSARSLRQVKHGPDSNWEWIGSCGVGRMPAQRSRVLAHGAMG